MPRVDHELRAAEAQFANHPGRFSGFAADAVVNNLPISIRDRVFHCLHRIPNHPINLIKRRIEQYFTEARPELNLRRFDKMHPLVTTAQNFDSLLFPDNHPGRSLRDTFYVDREHVLRTHTSAHQLQLLSSGEQGFLVSGPCFRRDEIDERHYPIFHQMEGVYLLPLDAAQRDSMCLINSEPTERLVVEHLKSTLEGLVRFLFASSGESLQFRWVEGQFPFTRPSLELEIYYKNNWLEVLGWSVISESLASTFSD